MTDTAAAWTLELRRDPAPTVYEMALDVAMPQDLRSGILRKCVDPNHTPAHIDGYVLTQVDDRQKVATYEWVGTGESAAAVMDAVTARLTDPKRPAVVRLH